MVNKLRYIRSSKYKVECIYIDSKDSNEAESINEKILFSKGTK